MSTSIQLSSLPSEPSAAVREGRELFGDDLDEEGVARWFAEEREAYANYLSDKGQPRGALCFYVARLLRALDRHRVRGRAPRVCIVGPGEGAEVHALIAKYANARITLIEPSAVLRRNLTAKFPDARVLDVGIAGSLPLNAGSQDIMVSMGVLHHVPRVTFALAEFYRVLMKGGLVYMREPCSSMGVWGERSGLTPNERGIPSHWMASSLYRVGFELLDRPIAVGWDPLLKLGSKVLPCEVLGGASWLRLDEWVSGILSRHDVYYRESLLDKFGPSSYEYVALRA